MKGKEYLYPSQAPKGRVKNLARAAVKGVAPVRWFFSSHGGHVRLNFEPKWDVP